MRGKVHVLARASAWAFVQRATVVYIPDKGVGMLKKRTMSPDKFIDCYVKGEDGRLKELYQAIAAVKKAERLQFLSMENLRKYLHFLEILLLD